MKTARAFAVALLATFRLAADATAQVPSPTGNLYGTVRDTDGNALSGVTVTVAGPGAAQAADSDPKGDFHFLNLSPGAYVVTLKRAGFDTARRDVTLALRNAVLSVTMPVAGVAEAVTVEGGPALDSRKVQTGATYGEKELQSIPTTRDPWAILRQVPGVLLDNVNVGGGKRQEQSFFNGKGSSSDQNSYDLDGVAISVGNISPIFFDFDSLSHIEIATGGSDLSLATPGVTLNLVTKRGTNELRGSARGLLTSGSGWDYGVEAGGPVWKDRLWLWGAFAHNDFLGEEFLNRADEPLRSQITYAHWNAKLNAQLVAANALTFSYTNFERTAIGWQIGAEDSEASSWDNDHPGVSYRVEDSHVLSAKLFASAYFSYVPASSIYTPVGGLDQQADADQFGVWRHSFFSRRVLDIKHQAGLSVSAFFDTGALRHELKFGFDYRRIRFDSALSWPGDQLVGHVRDGFAEITRPQNAKSEVNLYDARVGDTIQAGNLTVNVGARFDYQQGRNVASAAPANPVFPSLLPSVQYAGDPTYPITWRQAEPRVGATYDLGGGQTLARASYSRFANQLDSTTVFSIGAFPDGGASLSYLWSDANGNGRVEENEVDTSEAGFLFQSGVDRFHPDSVTSVNRIAPDFKPATTDEFILGVERQISPDFSGSLSYTYRILRNPEFFPIVGTTRASYQYGGNATGTIAAGSFSLSFDEPYYNLTQCPDPCAGTELRNRPDARVTYGGFELQLIKAYSHGWMARVSFAYNDLRQDIGPGAIVDPNNVVPGTNASGPLVDGTVNATWQFNVSGMVELPFGVAAGMNAFGRQGFPTPYWVDVFTHDPQFFTSPQIGQATRHRTPNVFVLDLQLSKAFRIGSSVVVIPQFDCFNLLNSRTVLQRDGWVGNYEPLAGVPLDPNLNFNGVLERLSNRVVRGGLRIAF